jgi:drug/metabolite transporter (DMT)-like permease
MAVRCKALTALIFAELFWGGMAPIGKLVMDAGISSVSLTFFRIVGATCCFWTLGFLGPKETIKRRDFIKLFFAGLFYIVLNQGSYIIGLSYTSPIDASVICTSLPVVTIMLAFFIFHEKIGLKKLVGVVLGGVGALTLILSNVNNSTSDSSVFGNAIVFCSQLSVALYLVLFRNLIIRYHIFTLIKWMFLFSAIVFCPIATSNVVDDLHKDFSLALWLNVGYVVLFGTVLAYLLIVASQKVLKPAVVSIFNYLQPIVATILTLILGIGCLTPIKVLSMILVCVGVFIVTQVKE